MALQLLWNPDASDLESPQPDKDNSHLHMWAACWPRYKAVKPTLSGMHKREAGLAGFQRKVQLAPVPPGSTDHNWGTVKFPKHLYMILQMKHIFLANPGIQKERCRKQGASQCVCKCSVLFKKLKINLNNSSALKNNSLDTNIISIKINASITRCFTIIHIDLFSKTFES